MIIAITSLKKKKPITCIYEVLILVDEILTISHRHRYKIIAFSHPQWCIIFVDIICRHFVVYNINLNVVSLFTYSSFTFLAIYFFF